jgi:xanthine dehydrogenase YagR molybdenum-binding subunit
VDDGAVRDVRLALGGVAPKPWRATLFDERNGRVMNPSLAGYHVPVHLDVPEIEVMWTGIPDPHAPLGARGIGEIGVTGVGAAVANAVFNATGALVRDLPLTPDKLLPGLI